MVLQRIRTFKKRLQTIDDYDVVVVVCHSEMIWWLTMDETKLEEAGEPNEEPAGDEGGIWTQNGEIVDITKYILE